jgi:hypothetical protein
LLKLEGGVVGSKTIAVRTGDAVSIGITGIVRDAGCTRESVAKQTGDARLFISF